MDFQKVLVCQDEVLVNDLGIFLPYFMMSYISQQGQGWFSDGQF